jgi:hypothetical protein
MLLSYKAKGAISGSDLHGLQIADIWNIWLWEFLGWPGSAGW